MEEKYLNLLKDLIRLRPVTSDLPAVNRASERMHQFLSEHGLNCTMEELNGRKILYASTTAGKVPDLLMNAHIDVVPAEDEKQYEPEIKDGWLYARGAGDCLGNAVCIAKILCEAEPGISIGAIFTADEETGGKTTERMVALGYKAKRAIFVLDSWNDHNISCQQKGILIVKLTAHGKGGHSSSPWAYDNPIDKLMDGYLRFRNVWKNPTPEDTWHNSMAATVIRGGMVNNQIPDTAEMLINFRYIHPEEKDAILQQLREQTKLEVSVERICPPVVVSQDSPELKLLAETYSEITGIKVGFAKMHGATDARWFVPLNLPIAIFGAEYTGIHSPVEKARLSSIQELGDVVRQVCRKMFKS